MHDHTAYMQSTMTLLWLQNVILLAEPSKQSNVLLECEDQKY